MGVLHLRFGLGADAGIDREGDLVGFVDGRGLGFLLGEAVARLEGHHLEVVDALDQLVEFLLQAVVAAHVVPGLQQQVEGAVEIILGGIEVAGVVVGQARLVFLLDLGDQRFHRVDLGLDWFLDFRGWRRRRGGSGWAPWPAQAGRPPSAWSPRSCRRAATASARR